MFERIDAWLLARHQAAVDRTALTPAFLATTGAGLVLASTILASYLGWKHGWLWNYALVLFHIVMFTASCGLILVLTTGGVEAVRALISPKERVSFSTPNAVIAAVSALGGIFDPQWIPDALQLASFAAAVYFCFCEQGVNRLHDGDKDLSKVASAPSAS